MTIRLPLQYPERQLPDIEFEEGFYKLFEQHLKRMLSKKYGEVLGVPLVYEWFEYFKEGIIADVIKLSEILIL